METVWRFRIVLFMAFAVIIFGDLLGYGNNVNGEKDADNQQQSTALKKNHHHQIDLNHDDVDADNEIEEILARKADTKLFAIDAKEKVHLANNLREACLPKMLCEIAAKPGNMVTEKEKSLLDLIKSTTLSLVWHHSSPTRWHFAAHMGQLMRDSVDAFGGPMGCAELWPQCPFSSQLLMQLSKRNFKRN